MGPNKAAYAGPYFVSRHQEVLPRTGARPVRWRRGSAYRRNLSGPAANKIALAAIFEYFEEIKRRVPVIAQVTIEVFGTMLMGTEIGAALTALEPFPIDVIGMNCGTGPKQMSDNVRYLCQNCDAACFGTSQRRLARECWRACALQGNSRDSLAATWPTSRAISASTLSAAAAARRLPISGCGRSDAVLTP